jgi:hypothetical protein
MSKSTFEDYYKNIILSNKHRINYLRLSNSFTVDLVFSPPRIILKFVRLERLIFDNIDAKYLNNILNQLIYLSKFHSLIVNLADCVKDSLSLNVSFDKCESSPIEDLIINCGLLIGTFNDFLCCLSKVRHL